MHSICSFFIGLILTLIGLNLDSIQVVLMPRAHVKRLPLLHYNIACIYIF